MTSSKLREHLPFIIFYFAFLCVGLSIYSDYGVSWDESDCRTDNGIINTEFINNGNPEPLVTNISKYHGPAFELFLVAAERSFGLEDRHDIFLMRHLFTFLLFAIAVLFFYLISLKNFKSIWLSTIGCMLFVLSPRIFADSFYNNKDLVFMSLVTISIYTALWFLEKRNVITAILHAFVCGFLIDVRIMGLIIPCFTVGMLIIQFIRERNSRVKIILNGIVYILILAGVIILFWPVLWLGPIHHFMGALEEMSKYPWEGNVVYLGKYVDVQNLPWHYMLVWILVTTPILYTLLFLIGLFLVIRKIMTLRILSVFDLQNLYLFFIPLFAVIFLKSVVYDGWRHLFFIYPSFLLIGLGTLSFLISKNKSNSRFKKIIKAGVVAYCIYIGCTMIYLHPFENVYFNILAGKSYADARDRFEMDYWALSYKQAYEYILKNDTSSNIIVATGEPQPGTDNSLFLSPQDRKRISVVGPYEFADYFMTCYRHRHDLKKTPAMHSITRGGGIIHSIFDMREVRRNINQQRKPVASFFNDNENIPPEFNPVNVSPDSTLSKNNHVERVDKTNLYAGNFHFHPPVELTKSFPDKKFVSGSVKYKSASPMNFYIVTQIDTPGGMQYWRYDGIQVIATNEWTERKFYFILPVINSTNADFKMYLWNQNQNELFLDDYRLEFSTIDTSKYKSIMKDIHLGY